MSDVVVSVVESNTAVTVTEQDVAVDVTENNVVVSVSTAGIQGVPGANNDPTYVTVRNATGATLAKGTIVYISGANGNNVQVTPAIATGDSTSARTLGWLAADILNNGSGLCMVEGYLEGINTQGFTAGAQLYLSGTTAGAFTQTKPQAPIHLVYVGVVTKVSSGDGHVFVKVQNGYELEELHNVQIINPTNAQVLAYDSATQLWKNATNTPDGVTSITATAPLTGGTITSTGSIGLDQTALSITKSQVSDFTSGTVTSASTAQQAGTAVYSVNSGTAVYATTSGTAVSISGDITKSQVSDFTSGTVASAGTAQQAGTAVFANTSGTATYATTSGTATFADTSGTAVFATNASTAVTILGSIAQSQVTDLVTDLANTAKLNTANTFSVGGHVINNSGTAIVPLQINGVAGQSGDLVQVRDNSGNNNLSVSATYGLVGRNAGTLAFALSSASGIGAFYSQAAANVPLLLRGAASQSGSMLQFQNSAGSITANFTAPVNNVNRLNLGGTDLSATFGITVHASGGVGQVIRGAASQSADLFQAQTSAGVVRTYINSIGDMSTGSLGLGYATPYSGVSNSILGILTAGAGNIGIAVRSAVSQTADLTQWQSSAANVIARVQADGSITGTSLTVSSGGTYTTGSIYADSNWGMIFRGRTASPTNAQYRWANSVDGELMRLDNSGRLIVSNATSGATQATAQIEAKTANATTLGLTITGSSAQTADLLLLRNNGLTTQFRVDPNGMTIANSLGVAGSPSGISYAYFTTPSASSIPVVIRGAASQTANLLELQNSAAAVRVRVTPSGEIVASNDAIRGVGMFTFNYLTQLNERNSGGEVTMTRQTAATTNPGANVGRMYFRDGTVPGTLKLVVRAGAAGAETTILDNIPQ